MPYIADEIVQKARKIDLLTYLQIYEPQELVHFSGNTYCLREHDSLKISNGKWYWWSRGIGGHNALDFLIKVRGMDFVSAVERLAGNIDHYTTAVSEVQIAPKTEHLKEEKKELSLPEKNGNDRRVIAYLCKKRGIDSGIVFDCIKQGKLYEEKKYHNAVFIGTDEYGEVKYAACRGTGEQRFVGEADGSDKRFSFRLEGTSCAVHCFEAAIDLLSYATLCKMQGKNWQEMNLISVGGITAPKDKNEPVNIPAALKNYLETHPDTAKIYLHFDADTKGREAAAALKRTLEADYDVVDAPPKFGKDINDHLLHCREKQREADEGRGR